MTDNNHANEACCSQVVLSNYGKSAPLTCKNTNRLTTKHVKTIFLPEHLTTLARLFHTQLVMLPFEIALKKLSSCLA